jgi:ATP-dependent Lhr-like helicase
VPLRDPLATFSHATRTWFGEAFSAPTDAQRGGWPAIASGSHTLIHAPTGSGKTLAAFLSCLDRLLTDDSRPARPGVRVLYISPLKALAYDVERNLRSPLAGITRVAERDGVTVREVVVGSRTGDTPADARRAMSKHPPDILITTPESLYLLLTSQARETLRTVEQVIVDEVHALAATKRGAHLALSLERLEALTGRIPQRIGLSATQRPLAVIAAYLGGVDRKVRTVDTGARKQLDLQVIVPVDDMTRPSDGADDGDPAGRHSIWPSIYPRLLELIRSHRSTLVFVNSRRLAERMAARLNELAGEELVLAHHGSIAREQRLGIEEALKDGRLPALVATSSLELGIDMGAIDLVIQIEAPPSVAAGLQRIGRAGHQVGEVSVGRIFPKFRGDLLEAAVVVEQMLAGEIEPTRLPRNPLDVLAQQIVAAAALDEWAVDDLHRLIRRAESFRDLSRAQLDGVLDMLSGRYPSDEFAELKPRIVWDRSADTVRSRNDARILAITSGGTIPDRGLYGVFLSGDEGATGRRVGELDEEMVYESRVGETFVLGASTWRIDEIGPGRVLVSPAPGQPGKMPFWKGDGVGRPIELGRAMGRFLRETEALTPTRLAKRLAEGRLDERAATNLAAFLTEQRQATGTVPSDRAIVIERFRDELGDWRVCLLSPFGGRVHAPWSLAIQARLAERGLEAETLWSDDGIALRLPEADDTPLSTSILVDPEAVEELVLGELAGSSLFAARFRENAARALLLPRRRPGQRTPLWMQRQRSADLLAVAGKYGSFPIVLETVRECLSDVFDLPALREVLGGIRNRKIRVVEVETAGPSPFAASLLFDYIGTFLYEGDAPLAERRAQALALDRDLLAELLGTEEIRELLDPAAVADVELELQSLADGRAVRSTDGLHDLLRRLGDLSEPEVTARFSGDAAAALAELAGQRRTIEVRIGGHDRWIAIEDMARYRDALGVVPPPGLAEAWLAPVTDALAGLLARWARAHVPFLAEAPAERWGIGPDVVAAALDGLAADGALLRGAFHPQGSGSLEYADPEVLRALRRRSLARLRQEVEPVPAEALGRFLPAWQGIGSTSGGTGRLLEVIGQLEGAAIPASLLESSVLASRVSGYQPRLLDELGAAGEIVWLGRGSLGRDDGRIALYRTDRAALLAAPPTLLDGGPIHDALRGQLAARGAQFFRDLRQAVPAEADETVLDALWDLVWAGEVTNDTIGPVRALALPRSRSRGRPGRPAGLGPPRAAGRWTLVGELIGPRPSETARRHAVALSLLERHGVLTREAVVAEGIVGGFSAVYPILRALEEAGRVRRGYFVAGLGAAQFALAGAVDRLRGWRSEASPDGRAEVVVLAATDPAQPYGAALPWPRPDADGASSPQRSAGVMVGLAGGRVVAVLERGGRTLSTFTPIDEAELVRVLSALATAALAVPGVRELSLQTVNRVPVAETPHAGALRTAGFRPAYRGWTWRPQ